MRHTGRMAQPDWTFSEREFYLAEFRGRTLGIALPSSPEGSLEGLGSVLADLAKNGTRCVLLSPRSDVLQPLVPTVIDPDSSANWVGELWRVLRQEMTAGLCFSAEVTPRGEGVAFAAQCRQAVQALRLAKLIWIDARGCLSDSSGKRISLLDLSDLEQTSSSGFFAAEEDQALLAEIRGALEDGLASVNICSMDGLADELFTYAGSGTLLTPERYVEVRRLGVDDFDAAADLIARGVEEGYLAPRSEADVQAALGQSFGAFIEGRYLAGIGALVTYPEENQAEIASLYTLTRFLGEGVGGHLVNFAVARAREAGYSAVFACTTSPRVETFFLRQGFSAVDGDALPASKWRDYPSERRAKLHCLARSLD